MKRIVPEPSHVGEPRSILDGIVHQGAEETLARMLEIEIQEFLERHSGVVDDDGRRQVVRNGYHPERKVLTGAGSLKVK